MISPHQRALWRRDWLKGIDAELARRRSSADDEEKAAEEAAKERLFEGLRQMAERMAATAHLGPPPDKDDRSIAERLAAVLYLPMDEAEREQEEAAIEEWFETNSYR